MYSYPVWLLLFVLVPLTALLLLNCQRLKKYGNLFDLTIIGALIFSYPWDLIAVRERIWYFEKPHFFDNWLFGLPVEEYVFITGFALLFAVITILLYERYGQK